MKRALFRFVTVLMLAALLRRGIKTHSANSPSEQATWREVLSLLFILCSPAKLPARSVTIGSRVLGCCPFLNGTTDSSPWNRRFRFSAFKRGMELYMAPRALVENYM